MQHQNLEAIIKIQAYFRGYSTAIKLQKVWQQYNEVFQDNTKLQILHQKQIVKQNKIQIQNLSSNPYDITFIQQKSKPTNTQQIESLPPTKQVKSLTISDEIARILKNPIRIK